MHIAERAVFDLRRGLPVCLTGPDRTLLIMAAETLPRHGVEELKAWSEHQPRLLLTPHRARVLQLDPGAAEAIALPLISTLQPGVRMLAGLASGCPSEACQGLDAQAGDALDAAALALARAARLVPAVVAVEVNAVAVGLQGAFADQRVLCVPQAEVDALVLSAAKLTRISEANVPLAESETSRFVLYRESNGLLEHIAIIIGDTAKWASPVPVRLHSACLTGDLFASLRCDCGEQLRGGIKEIASLGGGVLLYLAQEGRGIGLANKLRAYSLQDTGLDTIDADHQLGFGDDERRYDAAVGMLRDLKIDRVRLLTNNPEKIQALEAGGVSVQRQALHGELTVHNERYLNAKNQRAGHLLDELFAAKAKAGKR